MFLDKAKSLGDRLLKAFDTPSGLPTAQVNLKSGQGKYVTWLGGSSVILSEAGSVQLEFRQLSIALGKGEKGSDLYADTANRAMEVILKLKGLHGLYPEVLDGENGDASRNTYGVGAFNDSFYEYLLKLWLQSGRKETKYREKWDEAVDGMHRHLIDERAGRTFVSKSNSKGEMEHLACFLPGALAMGHMTATEGTLGAKNAQRDLKTARALADTCYEMYKRQPTGLSPDTIRYDNLGEFTAGDPGYKLRPETVESLYWLHVVTGETKYQDQAWEIFQAIEKHCGTAQYDGVGYGAYPDVRQVGKKPNNKMESFFLGETLKYLYLIFDDKRNKIEWWDDKVITTEAHLFDTILQTSRRML